MVAYSSFIFLALIMFALIDGVVYGFTIELIYRDMPPSHSDNASASRLHNALHQSLNRAKYFQSVLCSSSNPQGKIIPDPTTAIYLIKIFVGSPPMESLVIADTGSDLIWIPCRPCLHCHRKNLGTPIFNQYNSSTYHPISCHSRTCPSNPNVRTSCNLSADVCQYRATYGDEQVGRGELATEMLTLDSIDHGSKIPHTNTIIGCEHEGNASSLAGGHGLVGLARGPLSLISQWDSSISGKFSYCLSPLYDDPPKSSKMNFGDKAIVSGYGVVSTPIYLDSYPETWYSLQLDGLTVGGTRLDFLDSESADVYPRVGNIIIDSGSFLTSFPTTFYNRVESAVRSLVKFKPVQSTESSSLCYNSSDVLMKDMPTMIAHFRGADVVLNPINTFIPDTHTLCLGIAARDDVCAFGCLAQQNFLIGYNLDTNMLSFKPTQCSKQ